MSDANTAATRGAITPDTEKTLAKRVRELEALLARVLAANIAQGCKPTHPRLGLVYDIQAAIEQGTRGAPAAPARLVDDGEIKPGSAAAPAWEDLHRPIENLLAAYQDKDGRPASSGVRASAPLQDEVGKLRSALNDLRTGSYQGGRW